MGELIGLGTGIALLVATYLIGSHIERMHFGSIAEREQRFRDQVISTLRNPPEGVDPIRVGLVTGSVVVSLDYFKRFLAGLRAIVGGRVHAYETLLDRARREALLRLRQQAREAGFDLVINVRLETSRMANAASNGQGIAGVEILAFGTGIQTRPAQGSPPTSETQP